jgi:hypothetical protein
MFKAFVRPIAFLTHATHPQTHVGIRAEVFTALRRIVASRNLTSDPCRLDPCTIFTASPPKSGTCGEPSYQVPSNRPLGLTGHRPAPRAVDERTYAQVQSLDGSGAISPFRTTPVLARRRRDD